MVEFRRSLAASFLFRFFVHVATQLEADVQGFQALFPDTYKSAAVPFHRPPVQGLQYWSKVPGEAVVGQPTRHMAADLQVCLHHIPLLSPIQESSPCSSCLRGGMTAAASLLLLSGLSPLFLVSPATRVSLTRSLLALPASPPVSCLPSYLASASL